MKPCEPVALAPEKPYFPGKALMRVLSPGGVNGLSILIYHRVLPRKDSLFPSEVDSVEFDHQIGMLRSMFNVIPLLEAVHHVRAGSLPPRAACITFDDGYADNAEVALPILQRHGVKATFFVATGFLDGGRMWNDTVIELVRNAQSTIDATSLGLGSYPVDSIEARQRAIVALIGQLKYMPMNARLDQINKLVGLVDVPLSDKLMMSSNQVKQLCDAGMEIGAHTVNHPILAKIGFDQARAEILEGKLALENITGRRISLFAYPNGKPGVDYLSEHVDIVKEAGFEGAVSTSKGASRNNADLFELPRFTPWDRDPGRFAIRMAKNLKSRADCA